MQSTAAFSVGNEGKRFIGGAGGGKQLLVTQWMTRIWRKLKPLHPKEPLGEASETPQALHSAAAAEQC